MAKNPVTFAQWAGRWLPSFTEPRIEQFLRARMMIPNGNCRHRAQSGCVVDEHQTIPPPHDHIVSVLILRQHLCDERRRAASQAPVDDFQERALLRQFLGERGERCGRQIGAIHQAHS